MKRKTINFIRKLFFPIAIIVFVMLWLYEKFFGNDDWKENNGWEENDVDRRNKKQ